MENIQKYDNREGETTDFYSPKGGGRTIFFSINLKRVHNDS